MKIRIKGNSVRYRLSKTDVARFATEGYVSETVDFGGSQLMYALQKGPYQSLAAEYTDNRITIYMPHHQANEWATTNLVGFEHTAGPLYLLVEKDFQCLDNVTQEQSDNYPNPNQC